VLFTPAGREAAVAALADVSPEQWLKRMEDVNLETSSAAQRLQYFRDSLKLVGRRPVLGWGGGGWGALYGSCQPYYYVASETHNHYLQLAVETGLLGLAAFLALWVIFFLAVAAARRAAPEADRPLVAGLGGAGVSFAIHSGLDFNLSYMGVFLLLWTLWAAAASMAGETGIPPAVPRVVARVREAVGRVVRPSLAGRCLSASGALALAVLVGLLATAQIRLQQADAAWARGELEQAEALFESASTLDQLDPAIARQQLLFYMTVQASTGRRVLQTWPGGTATARSTTPWPPRAISRSAAGRTRSDRPGAP